MISQESQKRKEYLQKYMQAYMPRYRETHKDKIRENQRRWATSVNGKRMKVLKEARRRAHKAGAKGQCSAQQLQARIDFYGGKCWFAECGKEYEAIDHVIPLSGGGTNWPANLRPICTKHNSIKGAKRVV